MIEKVVIESFRCLQKVDVPLKRLTVLIGENDTGKTTFLDALRGLNQSTNIEYATDVWRQKAGPTIILEQWIAGTPYRFSTGVKLMLFFLALSYHPFPPGLVLIEEPESGVHPKRLKEILKLLRGLTTYEHSKSPVQVVMSTHSPYLLDAVDLATDEVLIFRRQGPDGERTVVPADLERVREFLTEFNLGEVWYNEGEEGLVKQDADP